MSAAHWAAMRTTPRSTNSTTSGSTAKIADRPSESLTGSKTCVYMDRPPPFVTDSKRLGARCQMMSALHRSCNRCFRTRVEDRSLHHLLQRHAVSADRAGGGGGARAPRAGGGLSRGADVLRADALQQRLSRGGARADSPLRARVRR